MWFFKVPFSLYMMGTILSRRQGTTPTTTATPCQQETTTTEDNNGAHGHGPALRIPEWLPTATTAEHILPQSTLLSWSKADTKVRILSSFLFILWSNLLGPCNSLSCIDSSAKDFYSCDRQATRVDSRYPGTICHVIVIYQREEWYHIMVSDVHSCDCYPCSQWIKARFPFLHNLLRSFKQRFMVLTVTMVHWKSVWLVITGSMFPLRLSRTMMILSKDMPSKSSYVQTIRNMSLLWILMSWEIINVMFMQDHSCLW